MTTPQTYTMEIVRRGEEEDELMTVFYDLSELTMEFYKEYYDLQDGYMTIVSFYQVPELAAPF